MKLSKTENPISHKLKPWSHNDPSKICLKLKNIFFWNWAKLRIPMRFSVLLSYFILNTYLWFYTWYEPYFFICRWFYPKYCNSVIYIFHSHLSFQQKQHSSDARVLDFGFGVREFESWSVRLFFFKVGRKFLSHKQWDNMYYQSHVSDNT